MVPCIMWKPQFDYFGSIAGWNMDNFTDLILQIKHSSRDYLEDLRSFMDTHGLSPDFSHASQFRSVVLGEILKERDVYVLLIWPL